ncbi:hypothetical protein JYU14_02915 [Simkania negevensis]|uniref:Uncharacterized protein n=1 Tax=Simkania negevensis TaxID=83561 RepID=A0ABS3AS81_9BACT|nr:hypothetical protein [Simkania negevensis]
MIKTRLFIGVRVTSNIQKAFDGANPHSIKMFINNGNDYLHEYSLEKNRYVGKFLGAIIPLAKLDDLSANIASLLRHVAPLLKKEKFNFVALPLVEHE